jgi:hypothetical protein
VVIRLLLFETVKIYVTLINRVYQTFVNSSGYKHSLGAYISMLVHADRNISMRGEYYLLECDAAMFRRTVLPPSSASKRGGEARNEQTASARQLAHTACSSIGLQGVVTCSQPV